MLRGVANTIQITFMELKVQRPKLEDVGNAKAVTVKIAENVPHVKINQNLEVSNCTEPKVHISEKDPKFCEIFALLFICMYCRQKVR